MCITPAPPADRLHVLDYETILNCFIAVTQGLRTGDQEIFVIWPGEPGTGIGARDDSAAFIAWLDHCKRNRYWHLGYNIVGFDAQITEHFLRQRKFFLNPAVSIEEKVRFIKSHADDTIRRTKTRFPFKEWPVYKEKDYSIRVHDVMTMNNWHQAKRASLKWVEFTSDWPNVEEMPHPHDEPITTLNQLNDCINYCINDVAATRSIYLWKNARGEEEMMDQIALRTKLSSTYDLNLFSAPEPRISKEVFLHFLSERMGLPKQDIKGSHTEREFVDIEKVILPEVDFETDLFQGVHNWFKLQVVDTKVMDESDETSSEPKKKKKGPEYTVKHRGATISYGLGGIHGCCKPGVYVAGDGYSIESCDVTSFYPMLAIQNEWAPAHLPRELFCELYLWFFNERKKYGKKDPLNYLFKIILNATYGLSKAKGSFLKDPEFTYKITINGQLLLSMLYEMITTALPDAIPLLQNTDGLEFMIRDVDKPRYLEICKEWEAISKMSLEYDEYSKLIIADVNNYIGVYKDPKKKPKCKGRFEFEDLPLHKDKSFLIIPKAIYNYFIYGTDPKQFLEQNRNIYDYCGGARLQGEWWFEELTTSSEAEGLQRRKLQKLLRYYISDTGTKLVKCAPPNARFPKGRQEQLHAGSSVRQIIFNRFIDQPWEDYQVDESFYLDAILKEIAGIETTFVKHEVVQGTFGF